LSWLELDCAFVSPFYCLDELIEAHRALSCIAKQLLSCRSVSGFTAAEYAILFYLWCSQSVFNHKCLIHRCVGAIWRGRRHAEINSDEVFTAYAPHHAISVTSDNAVPSLLFHIFYGEIEVHEQTIFYDPVVGHLI
jgi:hypothetical protein